MRFPLITVLVVTAAGLKMIPAGETVHLHNGQFQKGTILSRDENGISFQFTRSSGSGNSKSQVNIPWKSIERIEFEPSPVETNVLRNPGAVALPALAKLWNEKAPWLSRPVSNAAEIGLIYAKKLAASKQEMAAEQALDLYQTISEGAWDPAKQAEAIRARLTLLLASGNERDAIREAEALAEASENPALLLEAKLLLAGTYFDKLRALEKENPRWFLDDEVKPGRDRLFNEAIDHSLFAYLFYGSHQTEAARGLLHAAKVYQYANDNLNSKICAEDILKLYPDSEFAAPARQHIDSLSKQETK